MKQAARGVVVGIACLLVAGHPAFAGTVRRNRQTSDSGPWMKEKGWGDQAGGKYQPGSMFPTCLGGEALSEAWRRSCSSPLTSVQAATVFPSGEKAGNLVRERLSSVMRRISPFFFVRVTKRSPRVSRTIRSPSRERARRREWPWDRRTAPGPEGGRWEAGWGPGRFFHWPDRRPRDPSCAGRQSRRPPWRASGRHNSGSP